MDVTKYSERLIVFIDVLGFGKLVELSANDSTDSEIVIERISGAILNSLEKLNSSSDLGNYQFTQFSDSFVISTPVSRIVLLT